MFVVGDPMPSWATGVTWINRSRSDSRWADAQASTVFGLHLASRRHSWAYLSNDDFFILRPVRFIAPTHRELIRRFSRSHGEYYQNGRVVGEWLSHRGIAAPVSFETHVPMLARVDRMLAAADHRLPAGWLRSVYGNLYLPYSRRILDPKVTGKGTKPHPSWPVVSTSDGSFQRGIAGKLIKRGFPDPGPYDR